MPAEQWIDRVVELAITIQQVPAPTFAESARAALVQRMFNQEGLADVQVDSVGNVLARLPGQGIARPLIISAHLDTVFPAGTDLTLTRGGGNIYGPGIGDNSLGVAALFAIPWEFMARQVILPGDVWLVANVCEEGLGDLRGMKAIADRFKGDVSAYLILEGLALGRIFHRGLGVRRYRIRINTPGGHSWVDFGCPSAIHEMATLIGELTRIPLPPQPRTTMNVGMISGGTTVNTIAAQAIIELDTRSEGLQELVELSKHVQEVVAQTMRAGIEVDLQVTGERPIGEIPLSHPLVNLTVKCLQDLGIPALLNTGSTDANLPLSRGYPAVTIGLTNGSGAHTVGEFMQIKPLNLGLSQLFYLTHNIFSLP